VHSKLLTDCSRTPASLTLASQQGQLLEFFCSIFMPLKIRAFEPRSRVRDTYGNVENKNTLQNMALRSKTLLLRCVSNCLTTHRKRIFLNKINSQTAKLRIGPCGGPTLLQGPQLCRGPTALLESKAMKSCVPDLAPSQTPNPHDRLILQKCCRKINLHGDP
jgi:hypothetical protein